MATYQSNDDSVVVVIGSGAGGGTLANELCQKGIKVVLLEAGKGESPESFVIDEWGSFGQLAWLDKRTTSGSWQVARDFSGLPAWICKTVGGSTTHWAGASLRLQEHEFRIRSVYGPMKGVNMLDWPLTLKELEPYYTRAEDKLGVTRTNGIPGLPGNNNFKVFYNGATKVGYKDCHTGRMAINSQPRHGRGACQQLGFCFQGCKTGAKWSTLYTEVPAAEKTGRLELRTECHATFDQPVRMWRGTTMAGIVTDEARNDPKRGFVGGYELETLAVGLPFIVAFLKPGAWGREFTEAIDNYANMAGLWIVGEDMPQASNRLTLHTTEKDQFGLPVPNVHYDDHP